MNLPTSESEKRELVEECRRLWGDEIATLLAEDLGLRPKQGSQETLH